LHGFFGVVLLRVPGHFLPPTARGGIHVAHDAV
jgi:hypothetical protein